MRYQLLTVQTLMVALLALVAAPSVARADGERKTAVWLAADLKDGAPTGESWGRLSLRNGLLSFRSMNGLKGWDVDLADAQAIQTSKSGAKGLVIETRSGQVYAVAILDSQMLVDSPRKALQLISSARLTAPSEATRLAEASGDPVQAANSVKVARLDRGQVR